MFVCTIHMIINENHKINVLNVHVIIIVEIVYHVKTKHSVIYRESIWTVLLANTGTHFLQRILALITCSQSNHSTFSFKSREEEKNPDVIRHHNATILGHMTRKMASPSVYMFYCRQQRNPYRVTGTKATIEKKMVKSPWTLEFPHIDCLRYEYHVFL